MKGKAGGFEKNSSVDRCQRFRGRRRGGTGFRRDNVGRAIPRDIITRFTCTYAGEEVFRMDLFTGVAANPFVAFTTIATETGDLVFEWTDQHGTVTREQARITVA